MRNIKDANRQTVKDDVRKFLQIEVLFGTRHASKINRELQGLKRKRLGLKLHLQLAKTDTYHINRT